MKDYKKIIRMIGYHGGVLFKGLCKMMYGVIMATVATVAIYGFAMISTLGGYEAVSCFLLSTCGMISSLIGIYFMGDNTPKETKK